MKLLAGIFTRDTTTGGEGVKPGTNARDPGPKSGTNFYGHQKGTKHANNYMKFTPYIV